MKQTGWSTLSHITGQIANKSEETVGLWSYSPICKESLSLCLLFLTSAYAMNEVFIHMHINTGSQAAALSCMLMESLHFYITIIIVIKLLHATCIVIIIICCVQILYKDSNNNKTCLAVCLLLFSNGQYKPRTATPAAHDIDLRRCMLSTAVCIGYFTLPRILAPMWNSPISVWLVFDKFNLTTRISVLREKQKVF